MNNLRNLRRKAGLSLAQIAKDTDIPIRTLEMWDSNKRIPQAYHRIKVLSELLGCDMDEFMTYEEECVYEGKKVAICLTTVEKDTLLRVFDEDIMENVISENITRDSALELVEYLKTNKDITDFMNNRIQFYEG